MMLMMLMSLSHRICVCFENGAPDRMWQQRPFQCQVLLNRLTILGPSKWPDLSDHQPKLKLETDYLPKRNPRTFQSIWATNSFFLHESYKAPLLFPPNISICPFFFVNKRRPSTGNTEMVSKSLHSPWICIFDAGWKQFQKIFSRCLVVWQWFAMVQSANKSPKNNKPNKIMVEIQFLNAHHQLDSPPSCNPLQINPAPPM